MRKRIPSGQNTPHPTPAPGRGLLICSRCSIIGKYSIPLPRSNHHARHPLQARSQSRDPGAPGAPQRTRQQPLVQLGSAHPLAVRASRPGPVAAVHHSPKAFLKRMDQKRINEAADDPVFLGTMNRVLSAFDSYHAEPRLQLPGKPPLQATDLIAYFCAEFGFHESLPIYSGGLGILAGDHCKGASDCACPSSPSACSTARAISTRPSTATATRPRITATTISTTCRSRLVRGEDGKRTAGRRGLPRAHGVGQDLARPRRQQQPLSARHAAGREQRSRPRIAHQLYGGDRRTRIEQEILLGVGGVRALAALGLQPTVWHINEGHAAFLVLERIRTADGKPGHVFRRRSGGGGSQHGVHHAHAGPAGHDHFADDMVMHYFGEVLQGGRPRPRRPARHGPRRRRGRAAANST
jgi:starch phosphorylase